jgi:uncharacterized membrane protein YeiB
MIPNSVIFICQYVYYIARKGDVNAEMPPWFTNMKVVIFISATETLAFLVIYGLVDKIILASHTHKTSNPIWVLVPFGVIMCYLNQKIIGNENRIQHYKRIFDVWDKNKKMLWTLFVIAIPISVFVAFLFLVKKQ